MSEGNGHGDLQFLRELKSGIAKNSAKIEKLKVEFEGHQLAQHQAIDRLRSAFPGGDVEGHRRYHELQIAKIQSWDRLTETLREKTAGGIIWGLMIFLSFAAWNELKNRFLH